MSRCDHCATFLKKERDQENATGCGPKNGIDESNHTKVLLQPTEMVAKACHEDENESESENEVHCSRCLRRPFQQKKRDKRKKELKRVLQSMSSDHSDDQHNQSFHHHHLWTCRCLAKGKEKRDEWWSFFWLGCRCCLQRRNGRDQRGSKGQIQDSNRRLWMTIQKEREVCQRGMEGEVLPN